MTTKYPRLLQRPNDSFFLLGMRGVGKSTWVREAFSFPVRIYDLLNETLFGELLTNRAQFYQEIVAEPSGTWIVVDEVQRIPGLLNECHRLIEERGINFALLGSSARRLRQKGVNLLGGRAQALELYPLTAEEMGENFNLENYLRIGGIPLVITASEPETRLKAYVQIYLREEIQQEALVRNLEGFAKFLLVAGLFHGQVLNVEGLARDAGVARTSVQGYLNILEDTLLAFRLRAFEGRLRVKEKRHPKLYWVDSGLARAAKKHLGSVAPEERGVLFEGFILQQIRTYQSLNSKVYDDIYYWAVGKKDSNIEVDILLERGAEYIAIEVKSSSKFKQEWTNGLKAIADLKGVKRKIIVYTGDRAFITIDKIEVMPVMTFIELLSKAKL